MKKFTVSAPGKAILFGEHAVVYGYPAIATTIGLHCCFTVTIEDEICDENIVVDFKDLSEKSIYIPIKDIPSNLSTLSVSEHAWMLASEILGCSYNSSENTPLATSTCVLLYLFIRALQLKTHECDYSIPTIFNGRHSIRIIVRSDIPRGSGTIVEDISSILEKSLTRELKQSFSDHVTRNQFLLNELGISNSVVNQIIAEMKQIGIPAKITGAGFGGFVLGFILDANHDEKLSSLIRNWNERSLWAKIVSVKAIGMEYNAHSF
uniref:GHMP kinase C-terminal domain-containing protein n=1 Tax=Trichobilharzia regenti TaxID=157069 RepID=A0AA85IN50_TRIRE|nr:unnamed protein product [Trichobilharzia regenti]